MFEDCDDSVPNIVKAFGGESLAGMGDFHALEMIIYLTFNVISSFFSIKIKIFMAFSIFFVFFVLLL